MFFTIPHLIWALGLVFAVLATVGVVSPQRFQLLGAAIACLLLGLILA